MRNHDPPSMMVQMHPSTYANVTRLLAEAKSLIESRPTSEPRSLAERLTLATANIWEDDVTIACVWLRAADKKAA